MENSRIKRLSMYQTAYSPLQKAFVKIESVYADDAQNPIIKASFADPLFSDIHHVVLFRDHELVNYTF